MGKRKARECDRRRGLADCFVMIKSNRIDCDLIHPPLSLSQLFSGRSGKAGKGADDSSVDIPTQLLLLLEINDRKKFITNSSLFSTPLVYIE